MEAIGPYQVRKILGRGTTGVVYEAWDPSRETPLAVKLVTQPMKDTPALRARLQRDATAASGLGHPNVAAVLQVGEHRGQPFVATELVPGVDLAQAVLSRKPFPLEWVLDVWRQIAEGLAYAHRSGLLHLDLKPSDVRVTPAGEVKLLDFGICHLKSIERAGSGPAVGGVHYRAPEQVEGRRPDRRADVFSAGAIVYELAARRRAFPGDDFTSVLLNITRGRPDPAALPRSPFSPGFEAIVLKSLARVPQERYASFEALHHDLVTLVRDAAPRLRTGQAEPPAGVPSPEREELYLELTRARAEDQLPRALDVCRRLLEVDPEDETARRAASEIEAVVQDRELEQLVGMALSHAADGELELAASVAEKVERLAPWSPRYLQLQVYLDEEAARAKANALAKGAREHLGRGDRAAAREAAERALGVLPGHPSARRILDDLGPLPAPPPHPRQAEIESLTSAAIEHFVDSRHEKARAAVERVLALDPGNRKALELLRILSPLG